MIQKNGNIILILLFIFCLQCQQSLAITNCPDGLFFGGVFNSEDGGVEIGTEWSVNSDYYEWLIKKETLLKLLVDKNEKIEIAFIIGKSSDYKDGKYVEKIAEDRVYSVEEWSIDTPYAKNYFKIKDFNFYDPYIKLCEDIKSNKFKKSKKLPTFLAYFIVLKNRVPICSKEIKVPPIL